MHDMRNMQIRDNALCDLRFSQTAANVTACENRGQASHSPKAAGRKKLAESIDAVGVRAYTVHNSTVRRNTMANEPLTEQQEKVLACVQNHLDRHGFPPTLREIGQAVGIANVNAVRGHVAALEKKEYIAKEADKARSIRVLRRPSALSRFRHMLHEIARTDEGVVSRVVYGLSWATAQGQPILVDRAKELVEEAFEGECLEHGWKLLEKEVRPDQVRLVVEVWPNHSPELAVRRLKWASNAVRRRDPRAFPGRRLWERGYAVTTDLSVFDEVIEQMQNGRDFKQA